MKLHSVTDGHEVTAQVKAGRLVITDGDRVIRADPEEYYVAHHTQRDGTKIPTEIVINRAELSYPCFTVNDNKGKRDHDALDKVAKEIAKLLDK